MMRSKFLILCTLLTLGLLFATGCGRSGNNNDTQAPYQDETNNDVNNGTNSGILNDDMDTNNGMENGANMQDNANSGAVNDVERSGGNLKDAGRNLVDSIQDAGSAIMDGVDNMGNGSNNTNNTGNTNHSGQ